jgi:hypothetical protein
MSAEPCLLCGNTPTENAHWPLTRRYGDATVPLCRICHDAQHWAKRETIKALIRLAPGYWKREGTYELYGPAFETWMSRRRYLEAVK